MAATLADVLHEALADEYRARDTCRAIIDRYARPYLAAAE